MRLHGLSGDYKRTVLGSQSNVMRVLIGPLECELLWNLSLEFYPLCELVSCQTPSGTESAVAVIISDLLSVCVANLCKCYVKFFAIFSNFVTRL
ncbi:hypothetical protein AVEN_237520-1 [Araneus ventricosus]|uniref:Uncharacterized protein n=1 Tax=Araneus ventricosus TaxID=182803 RepID=A0A4Y2G3L7_ARAVE|nr:hypothetical protein AVEN_237520-1 [Araneus ventricosus]